MKVTEANALLKWSDLVEALRLLEPNNVYRFFNYCMKLKSSQNGQRLRCIKKASSLKAEWKSFRGYYRKITRTKISPKDSEEINAVGYLACYKGTS